MAVTLLRPPWRILLIWPVNNREELIGVLKIHHSDILPCDTQDCLFEVWKWLKWGNVLCLCLYITWSWIHFSISYILPENGRTSFQVLQLKVMITWKNRPGGYCVENVFRTTAYIASPNGGQSNGDNAGRSNFCLLIFLTIQLYSDDIFSQMEASQTTQATSSGETDFSFLSSLSASASGEHHQNFCRCQVDVNKHEVNWQFKSKKTTKQVPPACRARDEELVVQLQRADQQR